MWLFAVENCKKRWRSLRDTFKKLDRQGQSKKSGDGLDDGEDKEINWPWFGSLVFLRDKTYTTR